ncbi:MAG: formyl-CoA transferase [Gemmatimonadetes bacterium]|nr:formyl-CoA transferase [Gemmatimonadota bacterium]
MTMPEECALAGVRVIDATDDLGAYAARLLADLGAAVVRLEPCDGYLSEQDPTVGLPDGAQVSLFERFVNAGKSRIVCDTRAAEGTVLLQRLCADADILLASSWAGEPVGVSPDTFPGLVQVFVTPFGRGEQPVGEAPDDLVVLGAGGLLALGGYCHEGPVAAFGEQSRYAASIYAAVGALVGLLQRQRSGKGTIVDVSAQECIAQALEDSVPTFALTGRERDRFGEVSREAGTGIYACGDGRVAMVAGRLGTAPAWAALVAWMNEEGADRADMLLDERWSAFPYRQTHEAIALFTEVFEGFAAKRGKQELYVEAQRRGIAMSPVNDIDDLLDSPQLRERRFFVAREDEQLRQSLAFPGAPYRLSRTPPVVGSVARDPGASEAVDSAELWLGTPNHPSVVVEG